MSLQEYSVADLRSILQGHSSNASDGPDSKALELIRALLAEFGIPDAWAPETVAKLDCLAEVAERLGMLHLDETEFKLKLSERMMELEAEAAKEARVSAALDQLSINLEQLTASNRHLESDLMELELEPPAQSTSTHSVESMRQERDIARERYTSVKSQLKAMGALGPDISHGSLCQEAEELSLMEAEYARLSKALERFSILPPNLELAEAKVTEKEAELAVLVERMERLIKLDR